MRGSSGGDPPCATQPVTERGGGLPHPAAQPRVIKDRADVLLLHALLDAELVLRAAAAVHAAACAGGRWQRVHDLIRVTVHRAASARTLPPHATSL